MSDVLILASASPRRAALLSAAGIAFEVRPAQVSERLEAGEDAERYVGRVARAKALAVAEAAPRRAVLGADTVVAVEGVILGKPVDRADAERMLRLLSGKRHDVWTGVCLVSPTTGTPSERASNTEIVVVRSRVEFALMSEAEIDWYVGTDEPADKAGAYAIQGLGSRFVRRIEGSYSNVVGLPVATVYQLCTKAGILIS